MRFELTAFAGLFAASLLTCATAAADSSAPDIVTTVTGDRFTGRVTAIGKDGFLRIANPSFEHEIGLRVSALSRVAFSPTVEELMPHTVRLTNGGVLAGRVRAISPTEVVVETRVAGKVAINRAFVEEIRFAPVKGGPPQTDFAADEMEPFKDVSAADRRFGGGLTGRVQLAAEYPQDKAITVLMEFVEGSPPFTVGIFVADLANPYANSVRLQWSGDGLTLNANSNNGGWGCGLGQNFGRAGIRSARICYDPVKRETAVWINGQKRALPPGIAGPATGKYITISCTDRMALSRIQVFEGMLAPGEENKTSGGDKAAERDVVIFANGDALGVENLSMADGTATVKSDLADLKIPAERLGAVIFRRSARKTPEAAPKAVLVRTARSTFILDTVELNDTSVVGTCAALGGEVRIDRSAVKLMRFSADPAPHAAAGTDTPPESPEALKERLKLHRQREMNR